MSQFARIEQLAQVLEVLQEKLQELLNGQKETQDEVKIVNEKMEKMDGRFGSMEARITATENTVVDKFTVLEQQVAALEAKNPVVELADLSEADHEAFEARVAKKIFSGEIFNSKIESSMNQLEARVINVELEVKTPTHQLDTEVIDNLQEITAGVSASLATKFSTREEIEEIRSQTEAMFGQAARARDADFNNLFKQVQTLNATTEKIVEKQRSVSFASADSSQRV
jgi:flagellar capping protein FliD